MVKSLSFVLITALKKKYSIVVLLADQAPGLKNAREYKKMYFTEIRSNVYL